MSDQAEQPFDLPDGIELLPVDTDLIDPDLALTLSGQEPELDEAVEEERPQRFGKTWAWDDDRNRFVRYGKAPATITGQDSAVQYAKNLLAIVRLSNPVFDDTIGLDDPWFLLSQPVNGVTKEEWRHQVTDALSIEPRFAVRDFQIQWANDGIVYYDFTLVIDESDEAPVAGAITLA